MPVLITKLLLIFAGVSLAMGLVSLILGLKRAVDRVYLYFAVFAISAGLFQLFLDSEFIDAAGIQHMGFATITFAALYYAILPWFFGAYSGNRKPTFQWIITSIFILTYLFYFSFARDRHIPVWLITAYLGIFSLSAFGIYISIKNNYFRKRNRDLFFAFSILILMGFLLEEVLRQFFGFYLFGSLPNRFQPIDLFPVFFAVLMGIKLADETLRKYRLEKQLRNQETRWRSLMENIQLIVVEVDKTGIIQYVNPFFSKITGYESTDVMGKPWIELLVPSQHTEEVSFQLQNILSDSYNPYFKNPIRTKSGEEHMISWTNFGIPGERNKISGVFSIGLDITKEEKAYHEIADLKDQLEKENIQLKSEIGEKPFSTAIIGKSDAIEYALNKAMKVASKDSTVLLEGETGVGKELFASFIHQNSNRAKKSYIAVNCGALPKELIESELFGHEKGSFTGAVQSRKGKFELADGGTILLDEISELPIDLQPKLLRVLQNGEVVPIGSQTIKKVNVRIISATNKSLTDQVERGEFRNDLFYRLNVYPITIPPLRQRKEDIPLLVEHFVSKLRLRTGARATNISKKDLKKLRHYDWPGNIRELENVIERAMIISQGNSLQIDLQVGPDQNHIPNDKLSLEEVEKSFLIETLDSCEWKINGAGGAAARLNMPPSTLRSKMKKLNITRP
jgi:PAS domain S-box-containing protein